jgi:hypothetical protein
LQPQALVEYTGYTAAAIREVAEFVADTVSDIIITSNSGESLYQVLKKFSTQRFECVAVAFEPPDVIDIL